MKNLCSALSDELNKDNREKYCFDTVPLNKLFILSILTFGFYELVWTYNMWKKIKSNWGYDINPFWRTFFSGFTNYSLFPSLGEYISFFNIKAFGGILLAFAYMAMVSTWKMHEPYSFISDFSVLILVFIQSKINKINAENFPNAKVNNWNRANILWAIPCGLLFILYVIGSFLPD